MEVKLERVYGRPSSRTFQIPPIAQLLKEEVSVGSKVCEPFPYKSTKDCFDYMNEWKSESADVVLLDPPYTKRQVSEHYKEVGVKVTGWHTSSGWTAKVKREAARILRCGGIGITFGYNSNGLGKINGVLPYRIMMVHSAGDHYDLLVTCEKKERFSSSYVSEVIQRDSGVVSQ